MKKRLFLAFAMLMTFCSFSSGNELILLAERSFTGIEEFTGWSMFGDGQEGNLSVVPDGLAINVGTQTGNLWQPQVMVIPDGIPLKKGCHYKVVVTAKFPCNGTLQINLGSWSGNTQNTTDVVATGDYQEVGINFYDYPIDCVDDTGSGNAHVLLHCGDFLGTTIVKRVQVYKIVVDSEAYAVYTEGSSINPNTLTFYYDGRFNDRPGEVFRDFIDKLSGPEWTEGTYPIEKVVFDESFAAARPTSTLGWFSNISTLTRIEGLQFLNTSAVTSMGWMFNGCSSLTFLNLGSFDTRNVNEMTYMFYGCNSLTRIIAGGNWSTQNVTESDYMFCSCESLVGGNGTVYDPDKTDKAYAPSLDVR